MYKYTLITFLLIAAGCQQSPNARLTAQTSAPIKIKLTDSYLHAEPNHDFGKAELIEIAKDVLSEMYFPIEKADVNNGLIRTRPLPGAQFFEFWRSDNVGLDNTIAANIHTIRRTVILHINQQDNRVNINCEVHTQRLSLPERPINSSTMIYGMFSQSSPLLQTLILNPEQAEQMSWMNLGRDSRLEAEIIKRIKTQIQRKTTRPSQTTENQT